MPAKVISVIDAINQVGTKDLDNCSVEELTQLQYWLFKLEGPIFVKTVGRLALEKKGGSI